MRNRKLKANNNMAKYHRHCKDNEAVPRSDYLKIYVKKTKQKLIAKNIEKLRTRRSELLYCSKRARPIPLHK